VAGWFHDPLPVFVEDGGIFPALSAMSHFVSKGDCRSGRLHGSFGGEACDPEIHWFSASGSPVVFMFIFDLIPKIRYFLDSSDSIHSSVTILGSWVGSKTALQPCQ
jgi:hypothetical protein